MLDLDSIGRRITGQRQFAAPGTIGYLILRRIFLRKLVQIQDLYALVPKSHPSRVRRVLYEAKQKGLIAHCSRGYYAPLPALFASVQPVDHFPLTAATREAVGSIVPLDASVTGE